MAIGRDLIRVLQAVSKVPEIEAVWKLVLHEPAKLDPNFKGVSGCQIRALAI